MRAKDVLLDALAAFSGTVVFVSHDRYFIDRLATRVLEVENGMVTAYEGTYEDYSRKKEQMAAGVATPEVEAKPKVVAKAASVEHGTTIVIEGGPDELDEQRASVPANGSKPRRLNPIKQKQMEERCAFLEEEIPRIEASIAHTEQQLGVFISAAETRRLSDLAAELRTQLSALTAEWEELTVQLEEQGALS
jgi:ATP-binding cassette, subfamily F, member 3